MMWPFTSVYRRFCNQAFDALKTGNADMAKVLFEQAIRWDRRRPRAFAGLGTTYLYAAGGATARGDDAAKLQYGDLSVRAFDEALRRETDPEWKAEHLWQKGVVLGLLGRMPEREPCWREADGLVPGLTAQRSPSAEMTPEEGATLYMRAILRGRERK